MSRKEFAEETFAAFAPFINIFDPGEKSLDGDVYHTITKEDWKNFRRYKNGEYVPDFSAKYDIALKIYKPWHVEQPIFNGRNSYYTSGKNGLGLLYQDTDAHHPWQTDQDRARELLEADFPFAFFSHSARGENGYVKTRYIAVSVFNKAAARMQDVIRRWFLHNEILCDYETKGTITTPEKSGSLAKLPFHTSYEDHRCSRGQRGRPSKVRSDPVSASRRDQSMSLIRLVESLIKIERKGVRTLFWGVELGEDA